MEFASDEDTESMGGFKEAVLGGLDHILESTNNGMEPFNNDGMETVGQDGMKAATQDGMETVTDDEMEIVTDDGIRDRFQLFFSIHPDLKPGI